jgi:hypothetical protein
MKLILILPLLTKAKLSSNYVEPIHSINDVQGKNNVETIHSLPHVETPIHENAPDHVLSVKCLSDHTSKRNAELNTTDIQAIPKHLQDLYNEPQPTDLGENSVALVPDPLKLER